MAEMDSILGFLENKKVLVTGATGFLAKIFIEKILRTQPNVGKLYCLMRAVDDKGANQRLQSEILEKDLFGVVKEKYGETWDALISEKIVPVAGDISCDDMGVTNPRLLEDMAKEVDIIVNLAATTNFDERYDLALGINTVGARNVMKFAKKCDKLVVYVHVSTAYVWGERAGVCPEHPFKMGETLNGAPGLDIDAEVRLAERTAKELHADPSLSDKAITLALKDLGIQRFVTNWFPINLNVIYNLSMTTIDFILPPENIEGEPSYFSLSQRDKLAENVLKTDNIFAQLEAFYEN